MIASFSTLNYNVSVGSMDGEAVHRAARLGHYEKLGDCLGDIILV